jgi:Putative multicopper oxidases
MIRGNVFQPMRRRHRTGLALMLQSVLLAGSLVATPWLFAAGIEVESHQGHASPVACRCTPRRVRSARQDVEGHRANRARGEDQGAIPGGRRPCVAARRAPGCGDMDKVKVTQGARCSAQAPVRAYDISAINVEITVNRFGDFYPGFMYVLTGNVAGIRAEEEKNRAARDSDDPTFAGGAVSNGLQGDLIQPLVIRANQGDCLRITLRNQIADEPTNMIVNGSQMLVASTGKPATANNPDALVPAGKSGEFEWYIPIDIQVGGRAFHSHASRDQYSLGMLGSLVVEPRGSRFLSPFTAEEMKSGWEAMIDVATGRSSENL